MRKFYDIEEQKCIDEESLLYIFDELKAEQPDEYNYTFEQYLQNCTGKNGSLVELHHFTDLYDHISTYDLMNGIEPTCPDDWYEDEQFMGDYVPVGVCGYDEYCEA